MKPSIFATLPADDRPEALDKSFLFDGFDPRYGESIHVSPIITRITARNPGSFARWGTNTYLIGDRDLVVIDPGPDCDHHWAALQRAIGARRVTHVCISHEHPDHSPMAWRVAESCRASVIVNLARDGRGSNSWEHIDCPLRIVPTPGHTAGHLSFELTEEKTFFSGDHVMAWATPVIRAPDGDLNAYLQSLDETIAGGYDLILPAHGPMIEQPAMFLQNYRAHRLERERQIQDLIGKNGLAVSDIVKSAYPDLDQTLTAAAADTVTAHLLRLRALGLADENGGIWRSA